MGSAKQGDRRKGIPFQVADDNLPAGEAVE